MKKRSWALALPLIVAALWSGAAPSQAVTHSWTIDGINRMGCAANDIDLPVTFTNASNDGYTAHTRVTSNGGVYMNEGFEYSGGNGPTTWGIYSSYSYGADPNAADFPIASGHPVKIVVTLEKPKGTVVSSWTLVTESCSSGRILYNGKSSLDADGDYVATPTDKCPKLTAVGRANGCPLRSRTLTLAAKTSPKRVSGRLYSAGYPALYASRPVVIWKVRTGPDLKVATLTTNSKGYFLTSVSSGYYYATSSSYTSPSSGSVTSDTSPHVHVP